MVNLGGGPGSRKEAAVTGDREGGNALHSGLIQPVGQMVLTPIGESRRKSCRKCFSEGWKA